VLGGAECVWRDVNGALALFEPDAFAAVNDIGTQWEGPLDIWATLHHEKMGAWRAERRRRGFRPAHIHIGIEDQLGIDRVEDYRWPGMNASGSSGLYAVKLLMARGFDRIVLAGVPMTAAGAHFFNSSPWSEVHSFTAAWREQLPRLRGCVKSMSGFTREILGEPDRTWLGLHHLNAGRTEPPAKCTS
jgi:hypothetical protein